MAEPLQRRATPGRSELRRLRANVFRLGSFVGLDTQAVVRFSEVISGRRWRRCGGADLERVAADLAHLASGATARPASTEAGPPVVGNPGTEN
jgi:hypothetical protein